MAPVWRFLYWWLGISDHGVDLCGAERPVVKPVPIQFTRAKLHAIEGAGTCKNART